MHSWKTLWLLFTVMFFCIYEGKGNKQDGPIISTKYGRLKGKIVEVKGTNKAVYVYQTIPFAKAPVGSQRFSAPGKIESWKGVRDAATIFPPMCLQPREQVYMIFEYVGIEIPPLEMNEDCLYLNVYTPVPPNEMTSIPVMVFIHGGGFMIGGAYMIDGSSLAAYGNVVVVVIQYRVGVLGFFSTGDEHARGNWGFLDQVAALRWVQENIKSFGGDPGSVTIFGESAGSISVSMHVLSPLSEDLFHRAISESGSAVIPGYCSNDPLPVAKMIANFSGCDTLSSASMVKCLREKSEEEILKATSSLTMLSVSPVIDGVFLTKSPEELSAAKETKAVPYLLGVTNHEAGWFLPSLFLPKGWQEGVDRPTAESVVGSICRNISVGEEFQHVIVKEYFEDIEDPIQLRDLILELIGDLILVIPTFRAAKYHRDAGYPVYFYEFQHRPSIFGDRRPDFVKSDHGDDLAFVFGMPFLTGEIKPFENSTEEEKSFSKMIMKYWSNFAYTGSPNGEGLLHWPAYDSREEYMQLNIKPSRAAHFKEKRVAFWMETLPDKVKEMVGRKNERSEL
ncbi:carboxylesterase 5A-like [Protopterus annectens]|uniref:carboxylesterase 5A-like n=1 Tax=Protopterus annectens TaxID=7888 RepID=UPI001CFA3188|nr:carboxylesterase 5A-like [Protopterus annectens]